MQSACADLEKQFSRCSADLDVIAAKLDEDFEGNKAYLRVRICVDSFAEHPGAMSSSAARQVMNGSSRSLLIAETHKTLFRRPLLTCLATPAMV
jgi:hypothetical protein